jgi:dipeptidyl aminopeptidase/acylaminoacyl peptidase
LRGGRIGRFALLALGLLGLVAGLKAARTYRFERSTFAPRRGPVPRPSDLGGIESLRDVSFRSAEGTDLRGWYVPSTNGAAIVFSHGSPADRTNLLPEARSLARVGYGVLLFDYPGHGDSGGAVHWGEPSRAALRAAVDFAAAQPGVVKIGAQGFSMGSTLVAQVAASDPRIGAVVMAGAYTSAEEQLRHQFRSWGPITQLPAVWGSLASAPPEELHTVPFMARLAPRPLLLIAGSADDEVPASMAERLFEAAREPKDLLIIPGSAHGEYLQFGGEGYLRRLRDFYDRALQPLRSVR